MQRFAAQRLAVRARAIAAATLLFAAAAQSATAQTVEQFYKGRQLTMLVFTGPGSTYDIYARVLARHFGDHVPGKPVVIVQNMLGAGGLKVEQYIYRIAPKDGTVVGTIGRGLPFEPMLGENEVNVDPLKFTWLGSMNRDVSLAMSWHTSKIKTFADLQQHQLLVPGTGAGADSEILPLAFNRLAGTQFKIIEGYRDTPIAALAMERGELDGLAYWSWSSIMAAHPDWIRDKKVNLLFHTGLNPISGSAASPKPSQPRHQSDRQGGAGVSSGARNHRAAIPRATGFASRPCRSASLRVCGDLARSSIPAGRQTHAARCLAGDGSGCRCAAQGQRRRAEGCARAGQTGAGPQIESPS